MSQIQGTVIAAKITTGDTNNTFPVADANDIKGGLHSVSTLAERDEIPLERKQEGMTCYVISEGKEYQWHQGAWREKPGGGISDAPYNGKLYGRKDQSWEEISINIDMGNALSIAQFDLSIDRDLDCGTAFDL